MLQGRWLLSLWRQGPRSQGLGFSVSGSLKALLGSSRGLVLPYVMQNQEARSMTSSAQRLETRNVFLQ